MKLKDGVIVSAVEDGFVVLDAGVGGERFNGMVRLNATGGFVAKLFEKEIALNDAIAAVTERYGIDSDTAERNVARVTDALVSVGLLR